MRREWGGGLGEGNKGSGVIGGVGGWGLGRVRGAGVIAGEGGPEHRWVLPFRRLWPGSLLLGGSGISG